MFRGSQLPIVSVVLAFLIALSGCGKSSSDSSIGASCTPGIPAVSTNEADYCPSIPLSNPSSPITISGTAQYEFRTASAAGLSAGVSTAPIRFAEVRVTNSANSLIQCAETTNTGTFSFTLPNDSGTYTISVTSRADNSTARVSVLDAPDTNAFYAATTTVVADGTKNVGTITAEGKNTVLGGAFNIFDQIVKSQEYLASETNGCTVNGPSVNCSQFNPQTNPSGGTSKAKAFWKAGFNPNSYFCDDASGVSFYIGSIDSLFILGGIDGDVNNSDTDHFDNSIIIHELAHFLEDQYSDSDSPGGSHDGNSINDPRLMWSEGWANFFQAAVLNNPLYQDTSGNGDGTTGNFFFVNLEFRCQNGTSNDGTNCVDFPSTTGEGNFREFSVTRALWDAIDDGTATGGTTTDGDDEFDSGSFQDNFNMPFDEIWTAFLNLASGSFAFRAVGLFHETVADLTNTSTNFTNYQTLVESGERHEHNRVDYPNPISSSTSCTTTISSSGSNLFLAHDYFDLNHGGGSLTLNLTYNNGSNQDMDLLLFPESHILGNESTAVAVANSSSDGGTETITISSLSAGRYLIDVHYFSGPVNQNYNLTINGSKACPETSF